MVPELETSLLLRKGQVHELISKETSVEREVKARSKNQKNCFTKNRKKRACFLIFNYKIIKEINSTRVKNVR